MENRVTAFEVYLQMNGITAYSVSKSSGHSKQKIYKAISNPKGIESTFALYFVIVGEALNVPAGVVLDSVRELEGLIDDCLIDFSFSQYQDNYYIDGKTNKFLKRKQVVALLLGEAFNAYLKKKDEYGVDGLNQHIREFIVNNKPRFTVTTKNKG